MTEAKPRCPSCEGTAVCPACDDYVVTEEDVERYAQVLTGNPEVAPSYDQRAMVRTVLAAVCSDRRLRSPNGTPADRRVSLEGSQLPCPVRSPWGNKPCIRMIPSGWHVYEGHPGGHTWMTEQVRRIMAGGHFDATAALNGEPFQGHLPEECPTHEGGECPWLPLVPTTRATR